MTPSPVCIKLIQGFETCATAMGEGMFAAYMPTPNDRPTIGWGSTGPDIVMGLTWTQSQCDARFAADLAKFAAGVSAAITGETGQPQFDAMVSLAYNIGVGAFKTSTLLRLHNAGDFTAAQAQFAVWNKQKGKVIAGLARRRAAEAAMYGGDRGRAG
jgi:lysozyme